MARVFLFRLERADGAPAEPPALASGRLSHKRDGEA